MADKATYYQKIGFAGRVGFGSSPALIIVDFCHALTVPGATPLAFDQSEAISHTRRVLEASREKEIPIAFTVVAYNETGVDGGILLKKIPTLRSMIIGSKGVEIDERLKPLSNEFLIIKKFASSFFGTNLASLLTSLKIDTTIVCGTSTSSCVRATCIDSISCGFRTIVPRECVADRVPEIHEANLFDIDSKCANVVSVEEVLTYLKRLPKLRA